MLQDAHIHLQDAGKEADQILAGASDRGVGRLFCNGSSPSDWSRVRVLAEKSKEMIPFFGVHPWFIDQARPGWERELRGYLEDPRSHIGEIGLDGAKNEIEVGRQREIFTVQLDMAIELNKSVAIHCVQAWDILVEELKARKGKGLRFMMHWFSGSPEILERLVGCGAYISFSPRLLHERAKRHRACLDVAPIERILLETDYPYLPDAKEGEIADASKYFEWLNALYGIASRLKKMDERSFTERVWENGTIFLH